MYKDFRRLTVSICLFNLSEIIRIKSLYDDPVCSDCCKRARARAAAAPRHRVSGRRAAGRGAGWAGCEGRGPAVCGIWSGLRVGDEAVRRCAGDAAGWYGSGAVWVGRYRYLDPPSSPQRPYIRTCVAPRRSLSLAYPTLNTPRGA